MQKCPLPQHHRNKTIQPTNPHTDRMTESTYPHIDRMTEPTHISEYKAVINARLDKKIHPKGKFSIKILLLECLLGYTRVDENNTKLNLRMWLFSF